MPEAVTLRAIVRAMERVRFDAPWDFGLKALTGFAPARLSPSGRVDLELLRARMEARGISNLEPLQGVAEALPFEAPEMMARLAKLGIGTRPFFWGMHEQPVFQKMGLFAGEHYPVTERLARRGFYIPSGMALTETQIDDLFAEHGLEPSRAAMVGDRGADMAFVTLTGADGGETWKKLGRELGEEGLDAFREAKHVHIDYVQEVKSFWFPNAQREVK